MKKTALIALVILSLAFTLKLKYNKVDLNGRVKISVPETLTRLTDEQAVQRYGFLHIPMAIFSDQSSYVSLSVTERIDSLSTYSGVKYASVGDNMGYQRDITIEKSFYKSTLTSAYENITFFQDTIKEVNGHQAIIFEYEGDLVGENRKGQSVNSKNYGYIEYFILNYRKYTVTFNCPYREKDKWQEPISSVMENVKIK